MTVCEDLAAVLAEPDPRRKLALADALTANRRAVAEARAGEDAVAPAPRPGRPAHWNVLPAMQVPERPDLRTARGRFLLVHAVAHIELSAVELALMAVADFPGQEVAYYQDMLHIAGEEVTHALLLLERLEQLGGALGEEPVHLGLWETAHAHPDLVERLAVVPRILEAKGLDVSGKLRNRLRGAGDEDSARALDRVYFDEIGHVQRGTRWYRRACERRGLDPEEHFVGIARRFQSNRPVPFDFEGRRKAGFSVREMEAVLGRALTDRELRQVG